MTFYDFSGFDLHLRSITNVIPLVLSQRFNPDLCYFQILLSNLIYTMYKSIYQAMSGILLETLLIWFEQVSIFSIIFGVLMPVSFFFIFTCPFSLVNILFYFSETYWSRLVYLQKIKKENKQKKDYLKKK